jgi:ribosomal protein L7Ae-like RNA K-turn-binding protein
MTEEERRQAFIKALEEAAKRYGVTVANVVQTEQLGSVVQARAVMVITPDPNWQPPAEEPLAEHVNNKVKEKA